MKHLFVLSIALLLAACQSTEEQTAPSTHSNQTGNTEQHAIVPAKRIDGRILGTIVEQAEKRAGELGISPEDMTIYVVKVHVDRSEHPTIKAGEIHTFYTKIPPRSGVWMNIATYSTQPAWIRGFD